ncbi:MAG: hypothetical protein HQK50_03480 [Oligoflexia bacterium]|nr:hypothetical protein [Oligoflexia bacterium]
MSVMINKMENYVSLLKKEIVKLKKSKIRLSHSYEKCKKITLKISTEDYEETELEHFETLTSRFARTADIITQKVLRLIESTELSSPKASFRDLANRSEKLGFVENAELLLTIRLLRNTLAHEYNEENLNDLFLETLRQTPTILSTIDKIVTYVEKEYP